MARTPFTILLLVLVLVPLQTVGQEGPDSLNVDFPRLVLKADGKLNETEAANPAPCVALTAGAAGPVTKNFNVAQMPFNGTWSVNDDVDLTIAFTGAASGSSPASSGFTATAELIAGTARVLAARSAYTYAPPNAPTSTTFTFPGEANASYADNGGPVGVKITLTPSGPGGGPGAIQNVAVACDRGSAVSAFSVLRGRVGDADTDGDGVPDQEDTDDDADGFADAEEAGVQCVVGETTYDFSKDPQLQPGDNDGDGDGGTDEAECAAGYDPTSALNRIPPPKPFPWGLIILALLVLGAAAGLYFFITTFGKSAALTVVSSSELFIKAGTTGKYEIEATSLRKKGEPIPYQLTIQGAPQGWDAKLNPDHVTLESVGTGKERGRFYLVVESPEHPDPESAVVTVKAVALNKAGRKDTWKLPAKAKTITSINVPPGAKVPVKRGGAVTMKTVEEEAKEEAERPALRVPDPWVGDVHKVIDLEGIGPEFAEKLAKAGVETTDQLLGAKPRKLAKKTGIHEANIHTWQSMSDLIRINGVGPQIAELLARAGVRSVEELAGETPKGLVKRVDEYLDTLEKKPTKAAVTEKTAKDWIAGAEALLKQEAKATGKKEEKKAAEARAAAPVAGAKPQLQVGGLTHEPPVFRQGESVKSTVTVNNAGPDEQKIKLSLFVNDGLADAQTINVKPGKSKEVKFKWTAQERNKLNIRGELVAG